MTRFTMLASLLVIVFIVPTRAAEVAGLLVAPKLQDLLRQEMQAVLIATDEIVNASIEAGTAMINGSMLIQGCSRRLTLPKICMHSPKTAESFAKTNAAQKNQTTAPTTRLLIAATLEGLLANIP